MYTHMYTHMHTHMHTHMYTHTHTHTHVHTHAHLYTHTCTRAHSHTLTHTHTHSHTLTHTHTHSHTLTHTHTHSHTQCRLLIAEHNVLEVIINTIIELLKPCYDSGEELACYYTHHFFPSFSLSLFSPVKSHLNLHSRKYKHNRMCYILYDVRYYSIAVVSK